MNFYSPTGARWTWPSPLFPRRPTQLEGTMIFMLSGERWQPGGDLHRILARLGPAFLWLGGLLLLYVTLDYYQWRLGWDADAYWDTGHLDHRMYAVVQLSLIHI